MTVPRGVARDTRRAVAQTPVASGTEAAWCAECETLLGSGDTITAYGYRLPREATIGLIRLYCRDCGRTAIGSETPGLIEVLVETTLRWQSPHLRCTAVSVLEYSPPWP